MPKITYLFFGYACEYVLNPLFEYMKKLGYHCVELDLFTIKNAFQIIKSLKNEPVVFINSAHLFYDKENFKIGYQLNIDNIISPLEVMDYLRPIKCIHVPHDLLEFFHEREMCWLDLFDIIVVPFSASFYHYINAGAIDAGWIKRKGMIPEITNKKPIYAGFAFSDFEYYRRLGPIKTFEIWRSILTKNVTVKFPLWNEAELFEEYFISQGVAIFPSTANISEFIDQHHVIIVNGLSSVNAEAAYAGRMVINITPRLDSNHTQEKLKKLPYIQFMTIDECANYLDEILKNNNMLPKLQSFLKPFDFEKVIKNIVK